MIESEIKEAVIYAHRGLFRGDFRKVEIARHIPKFKPRDTYLDTVVGVLVEGQKITGFEYDGPHCIYIGEPGSRQFNPGAFSILTQAMTRNYVLADKDEVDLNNPKNSPLVIAVKGEVLKGGFNLDRILVGYGELDKEDGTIKKGGDRGFNPHVMKGGLGFTKYGPTSIFHASSDNGSRSKEYDSKLNVGSLIFAKRYLEKGHGYYTESREPKTGIIEEVISDGRRGRVLFDDGTKAIVELNDKSNVYKRRKEDLV